MAAPVQQMEHAITNTKTIAAASNSYYDAPGYRECRYVDRLDRWGNIRTIKVCDVVPY